MTYKVAIDLNDMNSSRLSQREFIQMIKENNALTGEIENLQAKLYSTNNINYIESRAIGELGMTYPDSGERIYITEDDMPEDGFGEVLKEKAYN